MGKKMKPFKLLTAFKRLFSDPSDLEKGFEFMLAFYRSARVKRVNLDEEGDMLLCQWGTYDWGEGEHFEFDFTRQIIFMKYSPVISKVLRIQDPEIHQLHLTFRFPVSDQTQDFGKGEKWVEHPDQVSELVEMVERNAGFLALKNSKDFDLDVYFTPV